MKYLLSIFFITVLIASAEPSIGVALENGVSPDKKLEVVLEADKDTPLYKGYEFKGGNDQFPAFLIREIKTGKVLARVGWEGDADSDQRPLRAKSSVHWNPSGTAVILNTSERHYSQSSIWALNTTTGAFTKLALPDYKTMTGFEAPSSDDLRPRGFSSWSWTQDGELICELVLSPLIPNDGGNPMRHKITLRLDPEGFEVIAREKLKE